MHSTVVCAWLQDVHTASRSSPANIHVTAPGPTQDEPRPLKRRRLALEAKLSPQRQTGRMPSEHAVSRNASPRKRARQPSPDENAEWAGIDQTTPKPQRGRIVYPRRQPQVVGMNAPWRLPPPEDDLSYPAALSDFAASSAVAAAASRDAVDNHAGSRASESVSASSTNTSRASSFACLVASQIDAPPPGHRRTLPLYWRRWDNKARNFRTGAI